MKNVQLQRKIYWGAIGVTTLFLLSVSLQSVAAASEQGRSQRKKWDSNPGMRNILNCKEAGVCAKQTRLILSVPGNQSDEITEEVYRKGCRVRHALRGALSLSCPSGVTVEGAEIERAFRAHGLISARHISADPTWSKGIGTGVPVAVLDTGIQASHLELAGRVTKQQNFTSDGYADVLGHGTHVAGIVAGQGVYLLSYGNRAKGVSYGASIYSGKVCNDNGWCLEGDILAGMEWAVAEGAKVVNLSLGGGAYGSHCDSDRLASMANWMVDQGVVVVAAAGNNSSGVGTPACGSKVIAVGAVDFSDERTSWSSYGEALDVMAPGLRILSSYSCDAMSTGTCPGDPYAWMSGTSMASPHVAGVAALLLERYPALTPDQVHQVLAESAKDLGSVGYDTAYGHGRVDALAAVELAPILFPDSGCKDRDGDGFTDCAGDCNENDEDIHPDAQELCNGIDDNCNEITDEDCRFIGFCGDKICQSWESRTTCRRDCSGFLKKKEKGKNGKNVIKLVETICGDLVCEGKENTKRCSRDCGVYIPGSSGKNDDEAADIRPGKGKGKGIGLGKSQGKGKGKGNN